MKYNNLNGTLSSSFKIGKNGTTIKSSDTGLNIVDDNNELKTLDYKDKVTYEESVLSGANKYLIRNQQGKLAKITPDGADPMFYCHDGTAKFLPTFDSINTSIANANVQPLMKLPDGIMDKIVKKDGQWGIEREIFEITLKGTDEDGLLLLHGEGHGDRGNCLGFILNVGIEANLSTAPLTDGLLCTHLPPASEISWADDRALICHNSVILGEFTLVIPKNYLTNWQNDAVSALKNYLAAEYASGRPVRIWAQKKAPTFEPIPGWNYFGDIDPINVTTTVTKPNESAPISPDNIATITGTNCNTVGYYAGQLMKLPNGVCDKVYQKNGVWGVLRNVLKFTLDGSEEWAWDANQNANAYYYTTNTLKQYMAANLLCDKLSSGNSAYTLTDYQTCIAFSGSIYIKVPNYVVPNNDINSFKAWLRGNNITFYGQAETPVFEPIPAWNDYKHMGDIEVTTMVTVPNPDVPISPSNVATIVGTTPSTVKGYYFSPLYKIDDVSDRIAYKDNQWGIERNIAKIYIDNSIKWNIGSGADGSLVNTMSFWGFPNDVKVKSATTNALCTHFQGDNTWEPDRPGIETVGNSSISFRIERTTLPSQDLDGLYQWLKTQIDIGKPVVLWSFLDKPIFEPIPQWNNIGYIIPFDVTVTITKQNPNDRINPNNTAIIDGTLPDKVTGYNGEVKVLTEDDNPYVKIKSDIYNVRARTESETFTLSILNNTPVPMALNSNKLNDIDGDNYLLDVRSKESGNISYQINNPTQDSIARISFNGKTSAIITDSNNLPGQYNELRINGVKDPYFSKYHGDVISVDVRHPISANIRDLFSLPSGVKDTVIKRNNVWGILRNVYELKLTGTETPEKIVYEYRDDFGGDVVNFGIWVETVAYPHISKGQDRQNLRCTHFKTISMPEWNLPEQGIGISNGAPNLVYAKLPKSFLIGWDDNWTKEQKTAAFASWVAGLNNAGTPLTVYYIPLTPVFEPISDWNYYKYIEDIDVVTTTIAQSADKVISPTNPASISGTKCSTMAHNIAPLISVPSGRHDRVAVKNGVWGIERKIHKLEFTGSETDITYGSREELTAEHANAIFHIWVNNIDIETGTTYRKEGFLCNCLETEDNATGWWSDTSGIGTSPTMKAFFVKILKTEMPGWNDAWTNVEKTTAFVTWIRDKYNNGVPLTVYIPLNNPVFEPVPEWNSFGKIEPLNVSYNLIKKDPTQRINPNNITTITGTPVITKAYSGKINQIMTEMFTGDSFDGVNLIKRFNRISFTGMPDEPWETGSSHVGRTFFVYRLRGAAGNHSSVFSESLCNYFTQITGDDMYNGNYDVNLSYYALFQNEHPEPLIEFYIPGITTLDQWKAFVNNMFAQNIPLTFVYKLNIPILSHPKMNLPLTNNITNLLELKDINDIVDDSTLEVIPDPNITGNVIYPYEHTKVGTTHYLTGNPKAEHIIFTSTGLYGTGNTWLVNGNNIKLTYENGEDLLPLAIVEGETIEAVFCNDQLRLKLRKPTPQPNLLDNWDLTKPVNQRKLMTYTGGYTIDRWYSRQTVTVQINDGSITLSDSSSNNDPALTQSHIAKLKKGEVVTIAILCEAITDSPNGITSNIYTGQSWGRVNTGGRISDAFTPEIGKKLTFAETCTLDHDVDPNAAYFSIGCRGTTFKIYAIKLERGPHFTGWNEPKSSEMLAECQRYFNRIDIVRGGTAVSTDFVPVFVHYPEMRRVPTVIVNGPIWDGGSQEISETVVSTLFTKNSGNYIRLSGLRTNDVIFNDVWLSAEDGAETYNITGKTTIPVVI